MTEKHRFVALLVLLVIGIAFIVYVQTQIDSNFIESF